MERSDSRKRKEELVRKVTYLVEENPLAKKIRSNRNHIMEERSKERIK